MLRRADLHESNHQLESRVREIRLPGSEGGAILISRPYPYPYAPGRDEAFGLRQAYGATG